MRRGTATRRSRREHVTAAIIAVLVACLAGAWTAPRASGAVGEWARTPPRTCTMTLPDGGELTVASRAVAGDSPAPLVTLDAGMNFTMIGVICDEPAASGVVTLRLRTSLDAETWSAWVETPLEVANEEGSDARAFTDPLWTGVARYVQVGAAGDGASAPQELSGTRLVAIDPTEPAADGAADTVSRVAAVIAGVSLVSADSAAANAPTIVTRAEWGADESLRTGSPSYAPVEMAFVHHTASGNTYTRDDAAALVRGVYAYHTKSLGWSDIGYNFLIDRFGTIYEGRYGGVTTGVVGAQVLGFNTGSTGVSVMGTFTSVAPPAEALASLERLLAWKLATHGLDPAGTAKLTCGFTEKYKEGATATLPVISGHREANFTECPGTELYALLPTVRTEVARRTQAPVVATLTAAATLISPNGDGVLDTTDLGVALTTAADWTLTLRGASGAPVAVWSGQSASATVTWGGSGASGGAVLDGVYTAELTASSALGDAVPAAVTIAVDTAAPCLSSAAAAPATFSPNGDDQAETSRVIYAPAEACAIRVGIQDADGVVRRWLHGWRTKGTGSSSAAWDGRLSSGGRLVAAADGRYKFVVERRDDAGNLARQGCKVTVDGTLGFPTVSPATISPDGDGHRDSTTLGFMLKRRATVTIAVRLGAATIRTLKLGSLGGGSRTVTWDGKTASGGAVDSSRPSFTVTAVTALGESSVTRRLVVDRYRPRLYTTSSNAATLGRTVRTTIKAHDPFSARIDLRYVIVDARGRSVASRHPGWIATGKSLSITWRPKARGAYTVVYHAIDLAGNREQRPGRTRITVR